MGIKFFRRWQALRFLSDTEAAELLGLTAEEWNLCKYHPTTLKGSVLYKALSAIPERFEFFEELQGVVRPAAFEEAEVPAASPEKSEDRLSLYEKRKRSPKTPSEDHVG